MRTRAVVTAGVFVALASQAWGDSSWIIYRSSRSGPPLDRVRAACTASPDSPTCEAAREDLARQAADDLITLGTTGDRAKWQAIVTKAAEVPYVSVRAAAASALGALRPDGSDTATLAVLLNDPVPVVRHASLRALQASSDPLARRLADRARRSRNAEGRSPVPELPPDDARLKAPVYTGASFLHFASTVSEGRAAFATADPVGAVLKFYGARSRSPVLTADQMTQAFGQKAPDDQAAQMKMAQELMARMMQAQRQGKSPQDMQAEMMRMATEAGGELKISEYSEEELYGNPRFVVLQESALGGVKKAVRFVAVFEDRALGQTGFVLHGPQELPAMPGAPAPR